MRVELVDCKTYKTAYNRCPWACRVMKVCGGFKCFESQDDYAIAKRTR